MTEKQSIYTNSIFEQIWWLEAVAPDTKWDEVLIRRGDKVVARMARPRSGAFVIPHMTQTIGYWLDNEYFGKDVFKNEQKKVVSELISSLPENVHISLAPENDYYLPFLWAGFTVRPYITYRINSLSNTDDIYSSFANVVRKNIKSALNKVKVVESIDISLLHELMKKTFKLQNRQYPYTLDFFKHLYNACSEHDAAKLLYALDDTGNIHSGVLFVYDENVCYYLIAGTDPQFRSSGANSLLIWEGIKFASTHSKCFDFEGSMIEGVENFFRQFGGEMSVYYDVYRQGIVQDIFNVIKPKIKKLLQYK